MHWWSPGSVFASIITRLLLMGLAGYGIAHLHPRIKRTSGFLADIVAFVLGVLAFFLLTAVWFRRALITRLYY